MKLSLRRYAGSTDGAKNAKLAWARRCGILVELTSGSNRGLGEASPLPGFSSDTIDDAEAALGSLNLTALERALGIEDPGEALYRAAALLPPGQAAARMALETAALDLLGQQRRASAPALLGADPGTERALAWLVNVPGARALEATLRAQLAGYGHFKIKLDGAGPVDSAIAGVLELRRALGPGPRLRLDVNRGWSEAQARSACSGLEPLQIEFIEEPCARFTRPLGTRIPLALDESLLGVAPADLAALVARCGAGVVVLKPMVLGGLSRCLALGRRAAALGLGVVVSHSFDGPVALAAAAALALALPTRLAQGLAPHAGLAAWPPMPFPIGRASLHVWSGPGLGLGAEVLN
jgi:o-succinylbenzoate synthase